jgi:hypothetical protein
MIPTAFVCRNLLLPIRRRGARPLAPATDLPPASHPEPLLARSAKIGVAVLGAVVPHYNFLPPSRSPALAHPAAAPFPP